MPPRPIFPKSLAAKPLNDTIPNTRIHREMDRVHQTIFAVSVPFSLHLIPSTSKTASATTAQHETMSVGRPTNSKTVMLCVVWIVVGIWSFSLTALLTGRGSTPIAKRRETFAGYLTPDT